MADIVLVRKPFWQMECANDGTDLPLFYDMESTKICDRYSSAPTHCDHNHVYGVPHGFMLTAHRTFHLLISLGGYDKGDCKSIAIRWSVIYLGTLYPSRCLFIHHNSFNNGSIRSAFCPILKLPSSIFSSLFQVGRIWWINRCAKKLLGEHIQKTYRRAISLL
jgi:hypothetical protein